MYFLLTGVSIYDMIQDKEEPELTDKKTFLLNGKALQFCPIPALSMELHD